MMRDEPKNAAELLRYLKVLRGRVEQAERTEAGKGPDDCEESEQMFRAIFDNAADGMLLVDVQSKRLFMANKVFREMLACSEEQLRNLEIADIHPEESLPYVIEQFEKQAGGELTLAKDIPVKRRDGSVFVADVNSFPITLGQKTYLMGIFRDITEREQAKKALAESEETARAFMNAITHTAVLMDAKLTILDINKAGAKKLGGSVGDIVGKNSRDLFPAEVFELRRAKAAEVIRTGKTVRYEDERAGMCFDTCICPVFDAQGKVERLAVFARDITSRKQLVQEAALLARFPEENPSPVLRISRDCTILYANAASSPVLATWRIQVGQRLPETCCKRAKEVLSSGKVSTFEFNCDEGRIFLVTLTPVVEEGYLYAYGLDITERKQAEQALRESEEQFRIIFERAAEGILLLRAEDGKIIDFNEATCEQLGYTTEEFQKLTIADVEVIESAEDIVEHMGKVSRNRGDTFETKHRAKDGSIRERLVSCGVASIRGQERVVSIWNDVTEIRQAAEALRQSEQKWRSLAENAPDVILTVDLDGTILFLNRPVPPLTQEQVIGTSIFDYIPSEHQSTMRNAIEQVVRTGGPYRYELAGAGPDGRISWYQSSLGPIKRDDQVMAFTLVARDVTEQKQTEDALRRSEERYRSVVEDSPGMMCSFLPNGEITFVNAAYCEYFGKSSEELVGSKFTSLIPVEDTQVILDAILSLTADSPSVTHEHKVIAPDGRIRWQRWTNRAFFDEQGCAVRFQAFGEDITERKHVEQALAESEQKYRTLVESAGDAIATIDRDGVVLFMNRTAAKQLGYEPEDSIGKTMWDLFPKEIADRRVAALQRVMDTGQGVNFVALSEMQGQPRWFNTAIRPLRDSNGNVTTAMLIARDVHDMKQAEEQIRTLSSAIEQSIDGIAVADLEARLLYVNEAYARMHGYTPEEMIGMKIASLHSNESMSEYNRAIHQIKTQGAWVGELQHIRKDRTDFPVYLSATLLKDDKGELVGSIGVCRDITEYKRAQQMTMIKDAAIALSINGIVMGDSDGSLTYVNDSFLEMWGYKDRSEVLGRNAAEFWRVGDEAGVIVEALQRGEGWIGELTAKRKDGSPFDVQVCQTSVRDEDGAIISLMASFVDITESKRNREQLDLYRQEMAHAERLASLGSLSATVAHELTQPLTVIRLSLESALGKMEGGYSPETVTKKLKDSLNQVSNIVALTERFRSFARKSSEHILREIDLKAVAKRIARFQAEGARLARIALRLEGMDGLPHIYWDERDLEQLFFALVDNAVRAADGKKPRQLIISGIVKDKRVELRFSDDCGGIAPENLERLFEPFFTTRPAGQGTGLGLCIVEEIVSRAGGRIRVESKLGEGSTFIVTLPINEGQRY